MKHLTERAPRRRGFTLVEIMVAVAIFALLAAATAPAMYNFLRGRETTGVISDMIETLKFAHQQAVFERQVRTVVIDVDKGSYWIIKPVDPKDERPSWSRRRRGWGDEQEKLAAKALPAGYQFGSVFYERQNRSVLSGQTAVHFFPDGTATGVAILLQRLPGSRTQRAERAIAVQQNTGRVDEMSWQDRVDLFGD